jgi:hypothetical protein
LEKELEMNINYLSRKVKIDKAKPLTEEEEDEL